MRSGTLHYMSILSPLTRGREGVECDMWLAPAACHKQCVCKIRAAGRMHTPHANASQVPPLGGAASGAKRNTSKSATDVHRREAQTPCGGSLRDSITEKQTNALPHFEQLTSSCRRLTGSAQGWTWSRTVAIPVAAWTRTRVPGCRFVASCRHACAVRNTVGTAAASASASAGGHGQTIRASTCTIAPRLPVAWPYTRSPNLAASPALPLERACQAGQETMQPCWVERVANMSLECSKQGRHRY